MDGFRLGYQAQDRWLFSRVAGKGNFANQDNYTGCPYVMFGSEIRRRLAMALCGLKAKGATSMGVAPLP